MRIPRLLNLCLLISFPEFACELDQVRYAGESAFAAVGRTAKFDATGGDYPQDNVVELNHLHELGVYTKQTAGYFQSQSAHNHLRGNLIYNGPRSGVNWNDGMGGGNTMSDSLLFNLVRETTGVSTLVRMCIC
jgi:hypothetical protein